MLEVDITRPGSCEDIRRRQSVARTSTGLACCGARARDGQEVPRAKRRTSLTLRRLAHVQLESKAGFDGDA